MDSHRRKRGNQFVSQVIFFSMILQVFNAYRATVVIGEVARRDTNRPVYEVHFPPLGKHHSPDNPPSEDLPVGVTPMRMVTARGQVMRCLLPAPPKSTEHSPSSGSAQSSSDGLFDDVDGLLREYENKCFIRSEGWWTYEFCYGKHVIQKHIIPKDREPEESEREDVFVLGTFDREADEIRRKHADEVSTSDAAFTQLYTNGTVCDMTDKNRRVLIKYICRDHVVQLGGNEKKAAFSNLNLLNAVREVESCVYEVEFINGAICQHTSYKEKVAHTARAIHCSLEKGEEAFEGLRSSSFRKASLTL